MNRCGGALMSFGDGSVEKQASEGRRRRIYSLLSQRMSIEES